MRTLHEDDQPPHDPHPTRTPRDVVECFVRRVIAVIMALIVGSSVLAIAGLALAGQLVGALVLGLLIGCQVCFIIWVWHVTPPPPRDRP